LLALARTLVEQLDGDTIERIARNAASEIELCEGSRALHALRPRLARSDEVLLARVLSGI
jgi:hypothetical protein